MDFTGEKYWEGIPTELRLLCQLEKTYNHVRHECVQPALIFLCERNPYRIAPGRCVTKEDYLRWLQAAFDYCLIPLNVHEEDWVSNKELIIGALMRAEKVLLDLMPDAYETSILKPVQLEPDKWDINEFAQKLNAYFFFYHACNDENDEMVIRLKMMFTDTKRNVSFLLENKEKADFDNLDRWLGYYFGGYHPYDTMVWLLQEEAISIESFEAQTDTYEQFAFFLSDLTDKFQGLSREKARKVQGLIEKRLQMLCDGLINILKEAKKKIKPLASEFEEKIRRYKEMKKDSVERLKELELS